MGKVFDNLVKNTIPLTVFLLAFQEILEAFMSTTCTRVCVLEPRRQFVYGTPKYKKYCGTNKIRHKWQITGLELT